jgi:hypothetical protein
VTLANTTGTYNATFTSPTFPISVGQQSGFSWYVLAQTPAASRKPVDLVVRDHYTHTKIGCYNAAPGEPFSIDFTTDCSWYDLEFSDDTDICGIYP